MQWAQAFEFLALMGATAHPGVQAEAVRFGAQSCRVFLVLPAIVRRLSTFRPARGPSAIR